MQWGSIISIVPREHTKTVCTLPQEGKDIEPSFWKKIDEKTDSLSCDLYDEFVWYKTKIPNNLTELTLSARHLFAVYINGKEVLNRNSYKIEKLQDIIGRTK